MNFRCWHFQSKMDFSVFPKVLPKFGYPKNLNISETKTTKWHNTTESCWSLLLIRISRIHLRVYESFNFISHFVRKKNIKFINIHKHTITDTPPRRTHYGGVAVIFRNMLCFLFLAPHTHSLPPSRSLTHSPIAYVCVRVFMPFCLFPESAVKYMIWSVKFCVKRHVIKFPFISMAKSWDVRRRDLLWYEISCSF